MKSRKAFSGIDIYSLVSKAVRGRAHDVYGLGTRLGSGHETNTRPRAIRYAWTVQISTFQVVRNDVKLMPRA